jgi:hypothetical protein
MKKILSILGILIIIAMMAIFGYIKYQNRETIVDLGNGWKSYHHNKIGITVRVPEDVTYDEGDIYGGTYKTFYVGVFKITFSNGLVKSIGWEWIKPADKSQNREKVFQENLESFRRYYRTQKMPKEESCLNDDRVGKRCFIHQHKIGKEIKIKNKTGFIKYDIKKCTECANCKDGDNKCGIERYASVEIPGYKRSHFVSINTDLLYKQNPYLKDIPFEELGEEYVKLIEPYILKVDNF